MVGYNSKSNTLLNQVSIIVPYKIDTDSDGNIMPLHLYKRLFPRATNGHNQNKNI